MRIEELRQIRNKNVAQQNELTCLEMKECADSLKDYPWVVSVLERYGQKGTNGILISLNDVPDQEGILWYASWLAINKRFYSFAVLTNREVTEIIDVESWEEISPEISAHKKGIGKTPAYIALELLLEYEES